MVATIALLARATVAPTTNKAAEANKLSDWGVLSNMTYCGLYLWLDFAGRRPAKGGKFLGWLGKPPASDKTKTRGKGVSGQTKTRVPIRSHRTLLSKAPI